MYSLFSYLLTYQINKLLHLKNIPPQRREVVVNGDGNCITALRKDEMSSEKHEKISRSSDALLGIIQRFLSCHFSHRPLWRILSEKARSWDGQSHITPLYIFPSAQAHHFNLLLSRGSCCGALFITKPRKKLEVDLTHVRKAEKVY